MLTVRSNRNLTIGNPYRILLIWDKCRVNISQAAAALAARVPQCFVPHAPECQYEHSVRDGGFVQYAPHPFAHADAQHIINMRPLDIVFGRMRSPSHALTISFTLAVLFTISYIAHNFELMTGARRFRHDV